MNGRLVLAFVCIAMLCGCARSFISSRTAYAPHDFARPAQVYPKLEAEACEHRLLGIWKLSGEASVRSAVGEMTKGSAKIDNLVAFEVESKMGFWLLGTTNCTVVSGYPVMYKDTLPHMELFEDNMLAGDLVRKPTTIPGTQGGSGVSATYTPTPREQPRTTPRTTPRVHTTPRVKTGTTLPPRKVESGPTKKQCERMCRDFSKLWKGSDAIRSTIRATCVKKCLVPDNRTYRNCVDTASGIDDISRCNSM